jgi:hypothetical protein
MQKPHMDIYPQAIRDVLPPGAGGLRCGTYACHLIMQGDGRDGSSANRAQKGMRGATATGRSTRGAPSVNHFSVMFAAFFGVESPSSLRLTSTQNRLTMMMISSQMMMMLMMSRLSGFGPFGHSLPVLFSVEWSDRRRWKSAG